jgi:hypothetical protein
MPVRLPSIPYDRPDPGEPPSPDAGDSPQRFAPLVSTVPAPLDSCTASGPVRSFLRSEARDLTSLRSCSIACGVQSGAGERARDVRE